MEIKRKVKDISKSNVVNRIEDQRLERAIAVTESINSEPITLDDVTRSELLIIGNIFAAQLGGVPDTNFEEFNKFLESDPYIPTKLAAFELAKYENGESALHLTQYGKRWFYQIAKVVGPASVVGGSFLTNITISTMTDSSTFKLSTGSVNGYLCTTYTYDFSKNKVIMQNTIANTNWDVYSLTQQDLKVLKQNDPSFTDEPIETNWDRIPVTIEHPLFSEDSLKSMAKFHLKLLHQGLKSTLAKVTAAKHAWIVNADAVVASDRGAAEILAKLGSGSDSVMPAISLKSYDGRVGDVIVPIGVPQDFTALLDFEIKVRYDMHDNLKIPDMSKQSAAKANKQDKEIVASTLNKSILLERLRIQKERLWVERARDWAMVTGKTAPENITATLETTSTDDIVGVNNANTNTGKQIATGNEEVQ